MDVALVGPTVEARRDAEEVTHAVRLAGRPLGFCNRARHHPDHEHSIGTLVGYVLRETFGRDEQVLWRTPAESSYAAGYDLAAFLGSLALADALVAVKAYHEVGRHTVIDRVYSCGCRS